VGAPPSGFFGRQHLVSHRLAAGLFRPCKGAGRPPAAIVVLAGEVFVNGQHLWSDESLAEPLSRSWNMPRQWNLPEIWLHDGVNTVEVRVVGVAGQPVGLGEVFLGEPRQIGRLHDHLQWTYRTLWAINLIVSGVIGILLFCVWIVRRDQSFYGWYALSSLFWVAFAANVLTTSPWPFTSSLMVAAPAWWRCCCLSPASVCSPRASADRFVPGSNARCGA
jgi:hypothetical protein